MPLVIQHPQDEPPCDFCYAPTTPSRSRRLPCQSFSYRNPLTGDLHRSVGDWRACPACYKLIRRRAHAKLIQRALASRPDLPRVQQARVRQAMRRLHDAFFAHWSGNVLPGEVQEPGDGTTTINLVEDETPGADTPP